ncbi:hypothetical protein B0I35DRAFT_443666 [Stachybotrys elegans]|uniref:Uncharacterized protein n=1 Tax=Stachybotrys elegans TaxID=80388 RepID=A0A8K0WLU6_9HYPO|nr:hypothetical protein B0I35DRAFT_443666 [Stachybotrys elegans]
MLAVLVSFTGTIVFANERWLSVPACQQSILPHFVISNGSAAPNKDVAAERVIMQKPCMNTEGTVFLSLGDDICRPLNGRDHRIDPSRP